LKVEILAQLCAIKTRCRPAFSLSLPSDSFTTKLQTNLCLSFRRFAAIAVPFTSQADCPFFCTSLDRRLSPRDKSFLCHTTIAIFNKLPT
jgi:hypothetical protein